METENFSCSQTQYLSAFDGLAQNVLAESFAELNWHCFARAQHIVEHHHYPMGRMEWKWPTKAMCYGIGANRRRHHVIVCVA